MPIASYAVLTEWNVFGAAAVVQGLRGAAVEHESLDQHSARHEGSTRRVLRIARA